MLTSIRQVIDSYLKLSVRSEEEVRSKLIVPLSEALGYDARFRGESFPVYSYLGGKQQATTFADFILFNNTEFNNHTRLTQEDQNWIQDHSLLIIEAKKPGKIPDVPCQAQFYSHWTKALAYLLIDGEWIKGWKCNAVCSDKEIINCKIDDTSNFDVLLDLRFDNLSSIKIKSVDSKIDKSKLITTPSELKLSAKTINYIRRNMGRNAEGLDDLQLVAQYLKTCDFILNSKNRYDIPKFALNLPREILDAKLYSDKCIVPIDKGTVAHSFWQDVDRYQYTSNVINFDAYVEKNNIAVYMRSLTAIDNSVSVRIDRINQILTFLNSDSVTVTFENIKPIKFGVMTNPVKKSVSSLKENRECFENWLHGLELMKAIEDYYQIVFDLSQAKDIEELYYNVALIYNGFSMKKNAVLRQTIDKIDDIIVEYPEILLENEPIDGLEDVTILEYKFHPYKTTLLPGKYKVKEDNNIKTVSLNICCEYKLILTE